MSVACRSSCRVSNIADPPLSTIPPLTRLIRTRSRGMSQLQKHFSSLEIGEKPTPSANSTVRYKGKRSATPYERPPRRAAGIRGQMNEEFPSPGAFSQSSSLSLEDSPPSRTCWTTDKLSPISAGTRSPLKITVSDSLCFYLTCSR